MQNFDAPTLVAVRQAYGHRLAMLGGIDKYVLRQDKAAIRRELEYKLQPLMRKAAACSDWITRSPTARRWRTTVTTSISVAKFSVCPHAIRPAKAGRGWGCKMDPTQRFSQTMVPLSTVAKLTHST